MIKLIKNIKSNVLKLSWNAMILCILLIWSGFLSTFVGLFISFALMGSGIPYQHVFLLMFIMKINLLYMPQGHVVFHWGYFSISLLASLIVSFLLFYALVQVIRRKFIIPFLASLYYLAEIVTLLIPAFTDKSYGANLSLDSITYILTDLVIFTFFVLYFIDIIKLKRKKILKNKTVELE